MRRLTQGEIVHAHFGKTFTVAETEIVKDEVAVDRLGIWRRLRRYRKSQKERKELTTDSLAKRGVPF